MMLQKLRGKNKEGFTLIELMVVITIIAILAAIGIPSYKGYLERTCFIRTVSDVRNACSAAQNFFVFNDPSVELDITVPPDDIIHGFKASEGAKITITGNKETLLVTVEGCDRICECNCKEKMECHPK